MQHSFEVATEQLLVRFGSTMNNINVRLFEPASVHQTVFCFHGFTGNGHDFSVLAALLAGNGVRVVCADMLGRGDSTYFDDPKRYNLKNMITAGASVLEKYAGPTNAIVGMGWGGLIGLLAAGPTRLALRKFVACDLPLQFSIDTDPVIAQGFADVGRRFASRDEALAHLAAGPEFAALEASPAALRHRVVEDRGAFRFNHDDRITTRTGEFAGRRYDLRDLYQGLTAALLLMYAGTATADVNAFVEAAPRRWSLSGLSPRGRLLLQQPAELLPLLGFLTAADLKGLR